MAKIELIFYYKKQFINETSYLLDQCVVSPFKFVIERNKHFAFDVFKIVIILKNNTMSIT